MLIKILTEILLKSLHQKKATVSSDICPSPVTILDLSSGNSPFDQFDQGWIAFDPELSHMF